MGSPLASSAGSTLLCSNALPALVASGGGEEEDWEGGGEEGGDLESARAGAPEPEGPGASAPAASEVDEGAARAVAPEPLGS